MVIFVAAQIFFIFFHLFYQSIKIKGNYKNQRLTEQLKQLHLNIDQLQQKLAAHKDLKKVKGYATNKLKMKSLKVGDMSKVPDNAG